MTLDTRDDRTLFFDLMPIFFRASGFSFRIKVYTVPGQPVHEATRKVVLAGADGVVFVADSSGKARGANTSSWQNLSANLASLGLEHLPVVVQYNKRDLPDAVSLEEVDRFGDPQRPIESACAKRGEGVVSTFFQLIARAWEFLDRDLDLSQKMGIDSVAFQAALAEHVGVAEPGRIPG
jgi:mutual gliding-motility protein MglA